MLTDNGGVIEAIISVPPKLFYGTGIPAAILVLNKNKPDELRNKVFFINADAEYAEGKNQNTLRPEDIEKISYVFHQKLEVPKYSRFVELADIESRDWSLNIRRYVDNTPEPEPEDVRAHFLGGVPQLEVTEKEALLNKFGVQPTVVFKERNERYFDFRSEITDKGMIRAVIEEYPNVRKTFAQMEGHLADWWKQAREDFAKLAPEPTSGNGGHSFLPEVRRSLISSLKTQLVPFGVLDEFQVAGVFVNWWDGIKYDLKTIMINGWSPTLIPDRYLIDAFFQKEAKEIEELEIGAGEADSVLNEAVDAAQSALEYESEEGEKITAALMRKELAGTIKDLKTSKDSIVNTDLNRLEQALDDLKKAQQKLRDLEQRLQESRFDLSVKLGLKRFGADEETWDARRLKEQAERELVEIEGESESSPEAKAKAKRLRNDISSLQRRIQAIVRLADSIGGMISEPEAKALILSKHHDLIAEQLNRYLSAEKDSVLKVFELLWEKYAASTRQQIDECEGILSELNGALLKLNYVGQE
jgi:type I restriction enzyme M protein